MQSYHQGVSVSLGAKKIHNVLKVVAGMVVMFWNLWNLPRAKLAVMIIVW